MAKKKLPEGVAQHVSVAGSTAGSAAEFKIKIRQQEIKLSAI